MKFRLHAASTHALVGLLLFSVLIWPVLCLWYPQGLLTQLEALDILLLIIAVDLVLGPLLTACVFSPQKTVRHRWLDESVVVIVQCAALLYGLHSLYQARPAYVVWHSEMFHVVPAKDIHPADAAVTAPGFEPSLFGPRWAHSIWPSAPGQRIEGSTFSTVMLEQRHYFPQYFHPLNTAYNEIRSSIKTLPKDGIALLNAELDERLFKTQVLAKTGQPIGFTHAQ